MLHDAEMLLANAAFETYRGRKGSAWGLNGKRRNYAGAYRDTHTDDTQHIM